MDRHIFRKLCIMHRTIGQFKDSRNRTVDEQVSKFLYNLYILSHHLKYCTVKTDFLRSREMLVVFY